MATKTLTQQQRWQATLRRLPFEKVPRKRVELISELIDLVILNEEEFQRITSKEYFSKQELIDLREAMLLMKRIGDK